MTRSPIGCVFVILPCLNEYESLRELLPALAHQLRDPHRAFQLIVVDDGSTDETSSFAKSQPSDCPVQVVRHESPQGYGAALRAGFLKALEQLKDDDAVVTLDADRTHDPIYVPKLLSKLEEGFDVVTASYSVTTGGGAQGVPPLRKLMSWGVFQIFHFMIPVDGITTYSNGFRAYRGSLLKRLLQRYHPHLIEDNGFAGGAELFLKACGAGARPAEVPFILRYDRRGESRIRLGRTIRGYLRLAWRSRQWS